MQTLDPAFITQLEALVGPGNVLSSAADCWAYGYDNSRQHALPQAVTYVTTHDEVRDVTRLCNRYHVPLVARGRGTGTAGASVPVRGGVVLALERMDRIVKLDADNRFIITQPGVTNARVQQEAAAHGFFWPPDPTSAEVCTVGGNIACDAAGPRAVKYGSTRDNVLGLRAVTGAGEEIRTGVYTTKGVVGYDLTRLIIGSEGTLAIVTEATLKLLPKPEVKRTVQAVYRDIVSAAAAVASIMAQAVTPCALEFIDAKALELVRGQAGVELPDDAGALLMIELDGFESSIDAGLDRICTAARNPGLLFARSAASTAEADELWLARRALSPALRHIAPKKINEDVVVPVSQIPALIEGLDELSNRFGITIVNFGHAGNGNIHVNLLIDPDDSGQMARAQSCLDEVFALVLRLGGTLSGEHGIGLVKRPYVSREIDPVTLEVMRRIKTQFDPAGILNPQKVLPDPA